MTEQRRGPGIAPHLTDDALAARLRKIRENIRFFSPAERNEFLDEAAGRLDDPRVSRDAIVVRLTEEQRARLDAARGTLMTREAWAEQILGRELAPRLAEQRRYTRDEVMDAANNGANIVAEPELFWNEFERWLEANGITFGRPLLPARRTFPATVDLGALKAGILELLDLDAGPADEPERHPEAYEYGAPWGPDNPHPDSPWGKAERRRQQEQERTGG